MAAKKTAAKKTAAKKTAAKKTTKTTNKSEPEKVVVRAVTAQGRVSLSNGVKVGCSVGRNGPVAKNGDEYIEKDGSWVPAK